MLNQGQRLRNILVGECLCKRYYMYLNWYCLFCFKQTVFWKKIRKCSFWHIYFTCRIWITFVLVVYMYLFLFILDNSVQLMLWDQAKNIFLFRTWTVFFSWLHSATVCSIVVTGVIFLVLSTVLRAYVSKIASVAQSRKRQGRNVCAL